MTQKQLLIIAIFQHLDRARYYAEWAKHATRLKRLHAEISHYEMRENEHRQDADFLTFLMIISFQGMIYQPEFRAYQRNYWPSDVLSENFEWMLSRFFNSDDVHEILWYHAREQRIALSAGLAECFMLLEEYQQNTNRLWLSWQMEE